MNKLFFGNTNLQITRLGFGAGQIGDASIPGEKVESILNNTLDYGINLIDTARGYGLSEERIGKFLKHRRSEFVLSTKVGYDIPGYQNWTYEIVIAGVENALKVLKTDYLDIVHLHSCELDVLQSGEVIEALEKTKEQGKVRYTAYSGENEELGYAINTGKFDSIQTSVNICDQRDIDSLLVYAKEKGLGIIGKRPLANAPWRYKEFPAGQYAEEYWKRWKKMDLKFELPWDEVFLRFAAYHGNVHTCIFGTANPDRLKQNIDIVNKGPLEEDTVHYIKKTFKNNDDQWIGQI
jgi:aryl-alcohol dehydrogenase-like predicted oxidoreductase